MKTGGKGERRMSGEAMESRGSLLKEVAMASCRMLAAREMRAAARKKRY